MNFILFQICNVKMGTAYFGEKNLQSEFMYLNEGS